VNFAPANVSLGVAAIGEFVLPIAMPVTAAMLVLSNLETFATPLIKRARASLVSHCSIPASSE